MGRRSKTPRPGAGRRAGFSAVEVTVGVTILFLMAGTLTASVASIRQMTNGGSTKTQLQTEAQQALSRIVAELRVTGEESVGGRDFPHVLLEDQPDQNWADHTPPAAQHHAAANEYDAGPNQGLVFLQPLDAEDPEDHDGDGDLAEPDRIPDIGADGDLVWDPVEYSYVVVTRADGLNYLERRGDGANPEVIARNVERVVFDDNASSGFQVPLNAIRVQIFMRATDGEGLVQRYSAATTVRFLNR